jgi:hypothetical protein
MVQAINAHKQMAMGLKPAFKAGGAVKDVETKAEMKKYGKEGSKSEERHDKKEMAFGGRVPFLKSGKQDSPLEVAKRNNGIPGFKKGGSSKGKC